MKTTFKEFINESSKTPQDVVIEYSDKYPEDAKFFEELLRVFPSNASFREELLEEMKDEYVESYEGGGENDEDDEDDFIMPSDDELWDDHWNPETEMHMIRYATGVDIDGEIWVDFHNDLLEAGW